MKPTLRAVIDVGRGCNLRCIFCYYKHQSLRGFKNLSNLKIEIMKAKIRGNKFLDFTGGEPTLFPKIIDLIKFATSLGLSTCVITHGQNLLKNKLVDKLIDAGVDDFLISIHGVEEVHDRLTNSKGGFERVNELINYLKRRNFSFRTNTVITNWNYHQFDRLRRYLISIKPRIVNFINFNPYYGWESNMETGKILVPCSESSPYIKECITLLEKENIGVNVRYYPFCQLRNFEKNICNMPQVMFDPYEWDYGVKPKTIKKYLKFSINELGEMCTFSERCLKCSIRKICGGINKEYYRIFGDKEILPYTLEDEVTDVYYYRKRTLSRTIYIEKSFIQNQKVIKRTNFLTGNRITLSLKLYKLKYFI